MSSNRMSGNFGGNLNSSARFGSRSSVPSSGMAKSTLVSNNDMKMSVLANKVATGQSKLLPSSLTSVL